jgi:hypothetical protein
MSEQNKTLMRRIVEEEQEDAAVIDEFYAESYMGHTPDGVLPASTSTPTLPPFPIVASRSMT